MHNKIHYIGCDDAELRLFESQYDVPEGMCYNSYLVEGDKIAILDTMDPRKTDEWLQKVDETLAGRMPDYLIVHHMEPDHSGSIGAFLSKYPETTVVLTAKALVIAGQFGVEPKHTMVVKEGDVLDLGGMTLTFVMAPMVHWPEVMMSYCAEAKTLFSADGFGKFGVYHADEDDWACEARRYYFNICGKYGAPVSTVLKKAAKLDIETICPLHGPVLEGEKLAEALRLYTIWSAYGVETEGVFVACASIHGNTLKAAERLVEILKEMGCPKVAFTDLCRDDMGEAIEDAFRYGKMIVLASSYDANLFPPMHMFLWELGIKGYQNKTVGIVENGSWAPSAAKCMKELLAPMKNVTVLDPHVTIISTLKDEQPLRDLAAAIMA